MPLDVTVNPDIIEMEYAVRGPIPQRAAELRAQGKQTIPCNIGNPQALGQRPITYYRQVLSLLEDPSRIARERKLAAAAPSGIEPLSGYVLDQAERILEMSGSGVGAYTDSHGPAFVREAIAARISG